MLEPWPADLAQPNGPMPPTGTPGWWALKTGKRLTVALRQALSLLAEVEEYILPDEVRREVRLRTANIAASVAEDLDHG